MVGLVKAPRTIRMIALGLRIVFSGLGVDDKRSRTCICWALKSVSFFLEI